MNSISPVPVTVFVEGVWDMMHYNHIEFLHACRIMGDRLVVGVVSDETVETYKRRPILSEAERLRVVRALPFVDQAFIYDGPFTPEVHQALCERVGADLVVYGSPGFDDYYAPSIAAGRFRRLDYREGISSTEIIRRVQERIERGLF
jgi:cytidyltransferase-like protein